MSAVIVPSPVDTPSPPPYRWAVLPAGQRAGILVGWLVLGLIETLRAVQDPTALGVSRIPWDYALVGNLPWWLGWGVLTPVVFRLGDRFRLDRPGWLRRLTGHLVAAASLIALHLPLALALWFWTNPLPQVRLRGFWNVVLNQGRGSLLLELLTYGAVLGLFYAIDNHRRLHWRENESARLTARAASLEAQAVAARLDALRMEIHPHFLFNALNTVSGLVRERQHEAAVTVLARLGELLRTTLDQAHVQQVPLEQELVALRLYLDIERERFRDRLRVRFDIAMESLACQVPAFCLQPLVENAVRHGISRMPGPGLIRIASRVETVPPVLEVVVENTGPGYSPGQAGRGIGLANVQARLTQLYGSASHLSIESLQPGGTRVRLLLPAVLSPEVQDIGQEERWIAH